MTLTPAQSRILGQYNAYVSATGIIWYGNGLYTHCTMRTKHGSRLLLSGSELLRFSDRDVDTFIVTPYSRPTMMPTLVVSGEKCYVDGVLMPYPVLGTLVDYSLNCYEFNDYKRWDVIMDEAMRLCDKHTMRQMFVEAICALTFAIMVATLSVILKH